MNHFCVYVHKRPDGSPFYVGKGTLQRARKLLRRNNPYHRNIVTKYGKENIIIEIAKGELLESEAFAHEVELIARLKELGCRLCNMSAGGEGPSNPSEETRRRMSESQSKRTYSAEIREAMRQGQLGRKLTAEVKAKISAGNAGKVLSEATKDKVRSANLGKKYSLETRQKVSRSLIGNKRALGNKLSAEVRAHISAKSKGRPWSDRRRKAHESRRGNMAVVQK